MISSPDFGNNSKRKIDKDDQEKRLKDQYSDLKNTSNSNVSQL